MSAQVCATFLCCNLETQVPQIECREKNSSKNSWKLVVDFIPSTPKLQDYMTQQDCSKAAHAAKSHHSNHSCKAAGATLYMLSWRTGLVLSVLGLPVALLAVAFTHP